MGVNCLDEPMELAMLKVPEVAARLRVSEESVRRWLRRGKIRGVQCGGAGWRVSQLEIERFERDGLLEDDEEFAA